MITLFIPFYGNKTDFIVKTLDNIHSLELISKVIIIDDNGQNNSMVDWALIKARYSKVEVHSNQENCGPAYSRNLALKLTNSKYILFCDADIVLTAESLSSAVDLLINRDLKCLQGVYKVENELKSSVSKYKHYNQMLNILKLGTGRTNIVGTSLFIIELDLFKKIGGFELLPIKRASVEDRIFGMQLVDNKNSNFIFKDFNCIHHHEYSMLALLISTFNRAQDEIVYSKKIKSNIRYNFSNKILVLLMFILSLLLIVINLKWAIVLVVLAVFLDCFLIAFLGHEIKLQWILISPLYNITILIGLFVGIVRLVATE